MAVTIRLPWPPSANHYWGSRVVTPHRGKSFISTYIGAKGVEFRRAVRDVVEKQFGALTPTQLRLRVTVLAVMPDRRTRDLSNLLKATEDALTTAGVWGDDSQIDDIRVLRGPVKPPGHLEVTIERMSTPVQQELFTGGTQ